MVLHPPAVAHGRSLTLAQYGDMFACCKDVGIFEDFTSQVITRPKYEDASDRW